VAGISLTGDNQATIQDNTLTANKDGILLTGSSTSGVDIKQNLLSLNTQSGIQIGINSYTNLVILNNALSANYYGFLISGNVSTTITNNSISYNTIGFYYQERRQHEAHFNDIYDNQYGMEAAFNTTNVNATYNYWGHETGPHHITLNPAGQGNPVGGEGDNIDFVFFLTAPIGYINQRPIARLLTDKNLVPPNQIVTFIATNSSDDRHVDQYFYDFGDGTNSSWTTLSIVVHKYASTGTYSASVKVMDDFGVTSSVATVQINVQVLTPLDVSFNLSPLEMFSGGQVSITVRASVGASPIESANIKLVSILAGSFASSTGSTNSTGYFTTTFTSPNVAQQTNLRIIATASKSGYADGSDHEYIQILPLLSVQVTANPNSIKSEAASNMTIHITHDSNPIPDVAVTISSDSGILSIQNGYTDLNGDLALWFTAPQTLTQIDVTITAIATKNGYYESTGQTTVTVNPRTLTVQISPSSSTIGSSATLDMTVHVTEDAEPVAEANVTVASNLGGNFSAINGNTDSNGDFKVVFNAPQTTAQINITVTATATKSGCLSGEEQANVVVNPPGAIEEQPGTIAGLPWTTILLIVIPIVIVVIVAVLIKKKIIVMESAD
jgi:parallel beta-helix repeat protein